MPATRSLRRLASRRGGWPTGKRQKMCRAVLRRNSEAAPLCRSICAAETPPCLHTTSRCPAPGVGGGGKGGGGGCIAEVPRCGPWRKRYAYARRLRSAICTTVPRISEPPPPLHTYEFTCPCTERSACTGTGTDQHTYAHRCTRAQVHAHVHGHRYMRRHICRHVQMHVQVASNTLMRPLGPYKVAVRGPVLAQKSGGQTARTKKKMKSPWDLH